jgi:hypothetical protein
MASRTVCWWCFWWVSRMVCWMASRTVCWWCRRWFLRVRLKAPLSFAHVLSILSLFSVTVSAFFVAFRPFAFSRWGVHGCHVIRGALIRALARLGTKVFSGVVGSINLIRAFRSKKSTDLDTLSKAFGWRGFGPGNLRLASDGRIWRRNRRNHSCLPLLAKVSVPRAWIIYFRSKSGRTPHNERRG